MDLLDSDLSGELRWGGGGKQRGLFLFPFNLSVSYFLCCVGNGEGGGERGVIWPRSQRGSLAD